MATAAKKRAQQEGPSKKASTRTVKTTESARPRRQRSGQPCEALASKGGEAHREEHQRAEKRIAKAVKGTAPAARQPSRPSSGRRPRRLRQADDGQEGSGKRTTAKKARPSARRPRRLRPSARRPRRLRPSARRPRRLRQAHDGQEGSGQAHDGQEGSGQGARRQEGSGQASCQARLAARTSGPNGSFDDGGLRATIIRVRRQCRSSGEALTAVTPRGRHACAIARRRGVGRHRHLSHRVDAHGVSCWLRWASSASSFCCSKPPADSRGWRRRPPTREGRRRWGGALGR